MITLTDRQVKYQVTSTVKRARRHCNPGTLCAIIKWPSAEQFTCCSWVNMDKYGAAVIRELFKGQIIKEVTI